MRSARGIRWGDLRSRSHSRSPCVGGSTMVAEPSRTGPSRHGDDPPRAGRLRSVIRWGVAVALLAGVVGAAWWYGVRDRPARLRARLDADLGAMLWDASADGKHLLTASFETPGRGVAWGSQTHRSRVWDA